MLTICERLRALGPSAAISRSNSAGPSGQGPLVSSSGSRRTAWVRAPPSASGSSSMASDSTGNTSASHSSAQPAQLVVLAGEFQILDQPVEEADLFVGGGQVERDVVDFLLQIFAAAEAVLLFDQQPGDRTQGGGRPRRLAAEPGGDLGGIIPNSEPRCAADSRGSTGRPRNVPKPTTAA